MKYMGSKKYMLLNGLGKMILDTSPDINRVVDLFCGAGAVSWFIAESTYKPVLAVDLQKYATIVTASIVERDHKINPKKIDQWIASVEKKFNHSELLKEIDKVENSKIDFRNKVYKSRRLCTIKSNIGPVWNAYGGYYFSPKQALILDFLIKYLPRNKTENHLYHAAIISTASVCAAAPGHTAQPFQPTPTAIKYLELAWNIKPLNIMKKISYELNNRHAKNIGKTICGDAMKITEQLTQKDLVIIDPPYSEVQYSRFYHVLETIANKKKVDVSGVGRYPSLSMRPQSDFSKRSKSKDAIKNLLQKIAQKKSTIILTFPKNNCSNGLSGEYIKKVADEWYDIKKEYMPGGVLSSMGGNNGNRAARNYSNELILLLTPKSNK